MKKDEFLNILKKKLSILEDSEVSDIINEYSEHIDEKIKDGSTEEEAINEFGDINELVVNILSAYKINKNYKENRTNIFIDAFIERCKKIFKKSVSIVTNGTFSDTFKLLLYVLFVLVLIAILKFPFSLIEDFITYKVIHRFPGAIAEILEVFLNVAISIIYILVSFFAFVSMVEKRLDNFVIIEESTKKVKKSKDNKKGKENKEEVSLEKESTSKRIVYKGKRSFFDVISSIVLIFIKVFVSVLFIPLIIGIFISSSALVALIILMFKSVMLFGPIILVAGVLVASIWLTLILFKFVFNIKMTFVKNFITFIISVVLCSVGLTLTLYEYSRFKIETPLMERTLLQNYSFNTKDVNKVYCYDCELIDRMVDNNMKDGDIIVKAYGYDLFVVGYQRLYNNGKYNTINIQYVDENVRGIINSVIEGLKQGIVNNYDYIENNLKVEVYANSKTHDKLIVGYGE